MIITELPALSWDAFCPDDGRPAALLAAIQGYRGPIDDERLQIAIDATWPCARMIMRMTPLPLTARAALCILSALRYAALGLWGHEASLIYTGDKERCRTRAQDALYTARLVAAVAGNTWDGQP